MPRAGMVIRGSGPPHADEPWLEVPTVRQHGGYHVNIVEAPWRCTVQGDSVSCQTSAGAFGTPTTRDLLARREPRAPEAPEGVAQRPSRRWAPGEPEWRTSRSWGASAALRGQQAAQGRVMLCRHGEEAHPRFNPAL